MIKSSLKNILSEVQLIVRFCFLEKPYWEAFIRHYYSLGVRNIHIIVQFENDIKTLNEYYYPKDLEINIYLSNAKNPNAALRKFKFNNIKHNHRFTLLVDVDEFIYFLNEDLDFKKLLEKKISIKIPWLMNPITKDNTLQSGFIGHSQKQLSMTDKIIGIKNCHLFLNTNDEILISDSSYYGVFLIHNWSRSLIDILLKSSFSNIKNAKTMDQDQLLEKMKNGILFVRAKYLAYLDIQNRYISNLNDSYVNYFDKGKELELISTKYSDSEIKLYYELYEEFKIKLLKVNNLEIYPPLKGNLINQMERINLLEFNS